MRILILLLYFFISSSVFGQPLKERRVYYLDCSYSMVTLNLWDKVRENLKNAIDNVMDETTELLVVPFAYDKQHHHTLNVLYAIATPEGKKNLKNKIDALKSSPNTMTYHCDPLCDFYANRVVNDKVTYMFLMTDGNDEDSQHRAVSNLLPQWGNRYNDKNVFGFYVILDKAAKNAQVEDVVNKQSHLWKVETADVNINLIRLQDKAIFNVRNEKYFDIPIYGNIKGMIFNACFPSSSPFKVEKCSLEGNKLRVYVTTTCSVHQLPTMSNQRLSITVSGCNKYDFLVTESIVVRCESKPERSLKISVR